MFEVFGLLVIRVFGFGWLWGKKDSKEVNSDEVFGNGGPLFAIGFIAVVVIVFGVVLFSSIGR